MRDAVRDRAVVAGHEADVPDAGPLEACDEVMGVATQPIADHERSREPPVHTDEHARLTGRLVVWDMRRRVLRRRVLRRRARELWARELLGAHLGAHLIPARA